MSSESNVHLDLLGYYAADKVTGFDGVITSISFDLYGCVQAVVTPQREDGKVVDGHWFDVTRLTVAYLTPKVMDPPNFDKGYVAEGKKGCANKPLP